MNMKFLSLLLLLSILTLLSLRITSAAACHKDDETGLLGFKQLINDPSGVLSSWQSGTDCCKWVGVGCLQNNSPRVTSLWLGPSWINGNSLSGTISPLLKHLEFLNELYISSQNITGEFPEILFQLPNLKKLTIAHCQLSGELPTHLGDLTLLEYLNLEGNSFIGPIPDTIYEIIGLRQLHLGRNSLTGTVPYEIKHLRNLNVLSLQENQLSGIIPDSFVHLTKLTYLSLYGNQLENRIPDSMSSLAPTLRYLNLRSNKLIGNIPDFLGRFLQLSHLDLSRNHFVGSVPASFVNLASLQKFDLSHNSLQDPFPTLNAPRLQALRLSYNNFHLGKIPSWVRSPIRILSLAKCGVKMKLDDWDISQSRFGYVDLANNEIAGSAVGFLRNSQALRTFEIGGNMLEFDLGDLRIPSHLIRLDLSNNSIFGNVTPELAAMEYLNVSHNQLCGEIPPTQLPASSFEGNDCLCGDPLPPCKSYSAM